MGMGYVYMWVEGNDNLNDFCKKRFGELPTFVEKNIGQCGNAKIYHKYKRDKEGHWHDMYFIFMPHPSGTMSLDEIFEKLYNTYCYEQILSDRNLNNIIWK